MSAPAQSLFERAAQAGGQLLRVERLPDGGREGLAPAFLLTFDVGRILLTVEGGALRGDHLVSQQDVPSGLVDAAEEEPWWRLLGNPLHRVAAPRDGGLDLQFRADDANPRVVRLRARGALVSAGLES
ncbi:MAG: hypothetical protein ACQGVK_12670 [Myxococcota bacterium]